MGLQRQNSLRTFIPFSLLSKSARIVFQLHREIFSPRRKKKKKKRLETIYIRRTRCVTRQSTKILFHTPFGWIMATDRAVRKIRMFLSPSVAFVYSL